MSSAYTVGSKAVLVRTVWAAVAYPVCVVVDD